MTLLDAIILGIVEGLTEFLPVSSTGHLILTGALLRLTPEQIEDFVIVIQLGAILAVAFYYASRVRSLVMGAFGQDAKGRRLLGMLLVSFFPAAVVGLLAKDVIEGVLFGTLPVAAALIIGGIAMIVVEKFHTERHTPRVESVQDATYLDALWIGIAQCFSLWPGMSRSMSTIVGAQLRGFNNAAAAEYSFLLALPTLGAATVYKLFDSLERIQTMPNGVFLLVVGNVVSFAVALLAIWGFIRLVQHIGMTPFGVYRIVLGLLVLCAVAMGWLPA